MTERIVPGRKFFVVVAGNTNGTHTRFVSHIKSHYVEVQTPQESDFILVFCPVVSRVGTDIGEALQNVDRDKEKVLVVMHHTFNPNTAIAESRRQVEDQKVLLTVDCLFYERELLNWDLNNIAWDHICRSLGIPSPQTSSMERLRNSSGRMFFVEVAGNTNNSHIPIVSHIKKMGCVEVTSSASCDFILLFIPVVSKVGLDIGEALQNVDHDKEKVLVVMHHTFNPNTAIAESRRQVEDPKVLLTVDCLFYERELLDCDLNNIAWDQICRSLGIPSPQDSFQQTLMKRCKSTVDTVLRVFGTKKH